ncbi:N-6 DNA methylase [Lachnoanaerobaculum umeaense]|uniref:site-specific DNA-methyltransferase (adenine-specific) n=1 Tax=Lachnoanaerobaculum umeaense TaxID=617123 RepID=A0A385Q0G1_9FIRM|nr:N-6 DNA methylase [Lachnoanaerobaculum umeaense]AYA99941.1 restriction endonuclease subunit M [Lachnoanaerobaculum umeaense]PZW98283.1 type I restriction enzyme M protein [Lachnoanaerobaculum umeaense]
MAKKKTDEKAFNIDSILFNCRDYLRAARNSGSFFEKRDMMLTLVFLRFIGEKYEDGIEALRKTLIEQGLDPDDENIRAAFFEDATFADGTYNLPMEARWSTIINTPAPKLNVALDTALARLEEEDPQLKGCFVKGTFTSRNLAANDIKKIVDEVNKISHKAFGAEKDLIGYVYEYFLKEFAVNATKEEGEFYTPNDVVQLIAAMIEPFEGTLYDPACGSGGMFIQSAELVKSKQGNLNSINIYGQEKEPATYRLAKMNLALRGISHNLGGESDSSFTHDLHKGLHFNYIMANPPFNLKGWYDENLKNDARWADYVTPPESNANYAWILHILSHLKPADGVAGFLLANGALNDSDTLEIRKRLIQKDKVEAIVVLPRELFITTDISVTLWILNQNKKGGKYHGRNLRNREGEILFMDLRQWRENAVKGENKKKVRLTSEQIQRAADIYHTWQCEGTDGQKYEVPELYRSVGNSEIEEKGWALTPSKYIEFIDHDLGIDYEKEMARIQAEMKEIIKREKESQKMLEDAFRGIGYGID